MLRADRLRGAGKLSPRAARAAARELQVLNASTIAGVAGLRCKDRFPSEAVDRFVRPAAADYAAEHARFEAHAAKMRRRSERRKSLTAADSEKDLHGHRDGPGKQFREASRVSCASVASVGEANGAAAAAADPAQFDLAAFCQRMGQVSGVRPSCSAEPSQPEPSGPAVLRNSEVSRRSDKSRTVHV